MKYSAVDFFVSSLLQWIFSEKHPLENAEYTPDAFVRLLMNAAQAKDYVGTISGILREYKKVVNGEAIGEGADKKKAIFYSDRRDPRPVCVVCHR
jgi:hypothetical protein